MMAGDGGSPPPSALEADVGDLFSRQAAGWRAALGAVRCFYDLLPLRPGQTVAVTVGSALAGVEDGEAREAAASLMVHMARRGGGASGPPLEPEAEQQEAGFWRERAREAEQVVDERTEDFKEACDALGSLCEDLEAMQRDMDRLAARSQAQLEESARERAELAERAERAERADATRLEEERERHVRSLLELRGVLEHSAGGGGSDALLLGALRAERAKARAVEHFVAGELDSDENNLRERLSRLLRRALASHASESHSTGNSRASGTLKGAQERERERDLRAKVDRLRARVLQGKKAEKEACRLLHAFDRALEESNAECRRLMEINLALRSADGDTGPTPCPRTLVPAADSALPASFEGDCPVGAESGERAGGGSGSWSRHSPLSPPCPLSPPRGPHVRHVVELLEPPLALPLSTAPVKLPTSEPPLPVPPDSPPEHEGASSSSTSPPAGPPADPSPLFDQDLLDNASTLSVGSDASRVQEWLSSPSRSAGGRTRRRASNALATSRRVPRPDLPHPGEVEMRAMIRSLGMRYHDPEILAILRECHELAPGVWRLGGDTYVMCWGEHAASAHVRVGGGYVELGEYLENRARRNQGV